MIRSVINLLDRHVVLSLLLEVHLTESIALFCSWCHELLLICIKIRRIHWLDHSLCHIWISTRENIPSLGCCRGFHIIICSTNIDSLIQFFSFVKMQWFLFNLLLCPLKGFLLAWTKWLFFNPRRVKEFSCTFMEHHLILLFTIHFWQGLQEISHRVELLFYELLFRRSLLIYCLSIWKFLVTRLLIRYILFFLFVARHHGVHKLLHYG